MEAEFSRTAFRENDMFCACAMKTVQTNRCPEYPQTDEHVLCVCVVENFS